METKICNRCNIEKNVVEFPDEKGKYRNPCKECRKKYLKEYYIKNKEKARESNKIYYLNNKEKIMLSNKNYRIENKDKIKEQRKEYLKNNYEKIKDGKKRYYDENREKILTKTKEYYKNNKEKIVARNIKYYKKNKDYIMNRVKIKNAKRKKEDCVYRLKCQIRGMIKDCFKRKRQTKNEKTEKILGCNIDFFQKHLLKTYKKNYGIEWDGIEKVHIDHIIPLATANTEEEIINLCHYTNLQLLKAKDNLDKKDKLDWELKQ